ncbi:MAG: hypothetical protein C0478_17335 [Planctomyces sp.]|nr:hypothetical protein [Planctomyces sp.]
MGKPDFATFNAISQVAIRISLSPDPCIDSIKKGVPLLPKRDALVIENHSHEADERHSLASGVV